MAKYDCLNCVNKRSPLCKLCTTIKTPSGKLRKPTWYVELVEFDPINDMPISRATKLEIAEELLRMLYRGMPLPTALVCEYNKKV